jgi:hypothetical protein
MAWHRRYGQPPSTILEIASKGVVEGLVLSDKVVSDCESCIIVKSKRSPFSATLTTAAHPLHRVFIDLGFVGHDDQEGRRLYLAGVDQASAARWTFALKIKSAAAVLALFNSWQVGAELVSGHKLKHVRSDNGKNSKTMRSTSTSTSTVSTTRRPLPTRPSRTVKSSSLMAPSSSLSRQCFTTPDSTSCSGPTP